MPRLVAATGTLCGLAGGRQHARASAKLALALAVCGKSTRPVWRDMS